MPLRFDSLALYEEIDRQRKARGLSWADVARETGVSQSTITGTRRGGRLEIDGCLAMTDWLGRTVDSFARRTAF